MRSGTAYALSLVLAGPILAATAPATFAQGAAAGSVTLVMDDEPDSLDPCEVTKGNVGYITKNNIIETVTEIDPRSGAVTPKLASSWERIDDVTWRFVLREGVTFHDGSPMTANAFIISVTRTLKPELACSPKVLYFEGITASLKEVDQRTVDVVTEAPVPIMPTLMSMMPVGSPSTNPNALTRDPIGTGPYRFVSWQSGQRIEVERFDGYWGEKPAVERATYFFRAEPSVRAAMVQTGEADIATTLSPQDASNPETDFSFLNTETNRLRFDFYKPPLNDIRVRQAINHAIDRQSLIGSIYPDDWQLAKNMVLPTINGANENVPLFPYDPDRARALVDEARAAGVPVDEEIVLVCSSGANGGLEGPTVMVEMLNEIGLKVRLQILESADWYRFYYRPYPPEQQVNMVFESHDNNSGDAGFTLAGKYLSTGGTSKLEEPEVDAMIREGLVADNPRRKEIFQSVFAKVHELVADAVLFHETDIIRVGPRVSYTPSTATKGEVALAEVRFR